MEMLLNEMHAVNKLTNGLQFLHITNERINPFLLQTLPTNPFDDMGLSPSSKINHGVDPYWDSNAFILSPAGSNLKKRRQLANKNGVLYSSIDDNLRGDRNVISLLARDQQGCRFLQGKFDKGKQHVDLIFDGVVDCVGDLMMDPFRNYLMQKLFDVCSEEQGNMVLLALTDDPDAIFRISMDGHGNYGVQYIIGLKSPSATANLVSQFEGNYVQLSMQKFSSNVVEKCLMEFREDLKLQLCLSCCQSLNSSN